jgi:hypothetical protein
VATVPGTNRYLGTQYHPTNNNKIKKLHRLSRIRIIMYGNMAGPESGSVPFQGVNLTFFTKDWGKS